MSNAKLSPERCAILACSSLRLHVDAAQAKMGTCFPVVELDRRLHAEPERMRARIVEALDALPAECDTVLVAMGYCGGSWSRVPLTRRVVIPKVDDCVTLLLHTDDAPQVDLKLPGHMYFRDCDTGAYSMEALKDKICRDYGMEYGASIFGGWFQDYTHADIIDTGAYDCYAEDFVEEAQRSADLIRCALGYVEGSNRVLEKLVSERWDAQFLVFQPGDESAARAFGLRDRPDFPAAPSE